MFRTNTAYNRFWEGRKIWEKILSSLRDLGRMTVLYGDVIESARVQRILHLLCVFPLGLFDTNSIVISFVFVIVLSSIVLTSVEHYCYSGYYYSGYYYSGYH